MRVVSLVFLCESCVVIPALCLYPLWCSFCALYELYPRVLFASVRCVRALSLFVCYYSYAMCEAYSLVFLCSVHYYVSCVVIPRSTLCLSPLLYSFCALYVPVRAIYLGTMCVCFISFRVLLFLCAV